MRLMLWWRVTYYYNIIISRIVIIIIIIIITRLTEHLIEWQIKLMWGQHILRPIQIEPVKPHLRMRLHLLGAL